MQALLKAGADVNETIRPEEASGPRPASGAGAPRPGTSALASGRQSTRTSNSRPFFSKRAPTRTPIGRGYTPLHICQSGPQARRRRQRSRSARLRQR